MVWAASGVPALLRGRGGRTVDFSSGFSLLHVFLFYHVLRASAGVRMAGLLSEEQLLRDLRVLYANRPLQFNKLITKYYKGERAKQIIDTLKTWPSKRVATLGETA